MLSAYWGFVLMSVHLGFHWSMMMGMAKKFFPKPSASTEVGAAHSGTGDCRIWRIRFYKERHRNLYAAQESILSFF